MASSTTVQRCLLAALSIAAIAAAHSQAGRTRGEVAAPPTLTQASPPLAKLIHQAPTLPPLQPGVTIADIVDGDRIFHSSGGCFACHGTEGEGLPDAGAPITAGLGRVPEDVRAIAGLIAAGLPDAMTAAPIAMPARGARGDLTPEALAHVAAYVWAISQTQGEPWPGGHASHFHMVPPGSTSGTASPAHSLPGQM